MLVKTHESLSPVNWRLIRINDPQALRLAWSYVSTLANDCLFRENESHFICAMPNTAQISMNAR